MSIKLRAFELSVVTWESRVLHVLETSGVLEEVPTYVDKYSPIYGQSLHISKLLMWKVLETSSVGDHSKYRYSKFNDLPV